MTIYELEERIYFDGAMPIDITEVQEDTSTEEIENTAENTDTGENNNFENVSIAPESPSSEEPGDNADNDSDKSSDDSSDFADSNSQTDGLTDSQTDSIAAVLYAIDDTTITDDLLAEQNFIIVSAENENFDEIVDSLNDNTTLIIYDSDDTFDSIIQQLKNELGDSKAVNIGIVDSHNDIFEMDSNETNSFLTELSGLQYYDGEINIINFSSDGYSITSADINQQSEITDSTDSFTDYFDSDSSLLTTVSEQIAANNNQTATDIYFIDSQVDDVDQIIEDILAENTDAVIIELGEGEGIDAMTDIIDQYTDIDSIHIVSQANYAQILLGDDVITADNIDDYSDAFSSWSDNLSQDADILFYGCDIAKDAQGQEVLNQISEWTGADIAASTDITGGNGGDWNLEFSSGTIEAAAISIADYEHHLETYTVTEITDNGSGTVEGTLSWAIAQSNLTTTVDDTINFNLSDGDTITISDALLAITDTVDIDGINSATGNNVTITVTDQNTSEYRVFEIDASNENVTISNMIIQGGNISSLSASESYGGSIYIAAGNVLLSDLVLSGSAAEHGGSIYNNGTLSFSGTNIFTCNSAGTGDAVYNNSTVNFNDSTIKITEANAFYETENASYNTGTSTVVFNGTGNQNISDINYANIILENGVKTLLSGSINASGYVTNNSTLTADGNTGITIIAADNITNSGSMISNGGTISFETEGSIFNYGSIDVSSENGIGGEAYLIATAIKLCGNSVINADGVYGGGKVRIGGGWQGGEDLATSQSVYMAEDAVISASATVNGDGGSVVLWSEGLTDFNGTVTADAINGIGGQVETSGKVNLNIGNTASVSMEGDDGTWLLDPSVLYISDSGTVSPPIYCDDYPGETIYASVSAIEAVTSGTVILQATNYIYVSSSITLQENVSIEVTGPSSGTIYIYFTDSDLAIVASGTGSITIDTMTSGEGELRNIGRLETESGNITLNAGDGIELCNTITTQGGNIYIDADSDQGGVGFLTISEAISTHGGDLTLKGGRSSTSGILIDAEINLGTGSISFEATEGQFSGKFTINAGIYSSGDFVINQPVAMGDDAAISTDGSVTFNDTVTITGSTDLILTGSSFTFANDVTGNGGQITFRPPTSESDLVINTLPLSQLSGFSKITCGREDGSGTLTFSADISVTQNSEFIMGGADGTININGTVSASGSASLTLNAGGVVNVSSNVTTSSGELSILGAVLNIDSGISVSSTSGDITIAANTLNIDGSASGSGTLTLRPYDYKSITVGSVLHSGSGLLILPEWLELGSTKFSNFNSLVLGSDSVTTNIYIDADTNTSLFATSIMLSAFNIDVASNVTFTVLGDLYLNTGCSDTGTANGYITNNGTITGTSMEGTLFIYTHADTGESINTLGTINNFGAIPSGTVGDLNYSEAKTLAGSTTPYVYYYDGEFSLIVVANNASKTYGDVLTDGTGYTEITVVGLQGSDTVTSVTVSYLSGATGNSAVLGNYTGAISISDAVGTNLSSYSITYITGNLSVNPASLTITANSVTKTYGDEISGGSGSTAFTTSGLVNSETIGSVTITYGSGAEAYAPAGVYIGSVAASSATGGTFTSSNYTITYIDGNISVNPASLTIAANSVAKTYGERLSGGSGSTAFTVSGLVNSETIGSVTITYGSGAEANAPAGVYVGSVVASSATGGTFTSSNYTITYIAGNITVTGGPSPKPTPSPTRPDINNGEMINDSTETQTHTSWRTSIDSDIGTEDNYYFEVENDDLFNDVFTKTTAALSSLSNGEYGLTNTGASSESSGISIGGTGLGNTYDGEYGIDAMVNGEYGIGDSGGVEQEFDSGYGGKADLTFNFENDNGLINYEAIAAYSERHPLFKTELDLLLEKI